ncbi:MAG TPA: BTAD domain-containing putative transcriptional regulator [Mycobacteriales bacterium]|nr:BTAD domain-containing putative transcriptional regulator [Mycobacteriales bacterium]
MEFRLLGPVEVRASTGPVDVGGAKPRTVLAMLLLSRGRMVSDGRLAAMLWGDDPPATASAQIQTYVSRLRQRLGAAAEIVRRRPGYLLRVPASRVDLAEFDRLSRQGRADLTAGRAESAAAALQAAAALWRGPALAGVTDLLAAAELPWLEEARLAALADRVEAEMALGRHTALVAELTGLVAAHPALERLRAQLMIGLHRCGRTADALAAYQDYRRMLATELGLDPGGELQRLHNRLLASDPGLDRPATAPAAIPAAAPPSLAADIADFTGRDNETARLVDLLTPRPGQRRPAIAVLAGMPGIGKTALAVHAAHLLRQHYPDGQLQVELGDATPAEALRRALRSLGVPPTAIPPGLDERRRLYHSRLAGHRVLVLLDDAVTEAQVRPLLPGGPGCAALLTSRSRLTALEGVPAIDLAVFDPAPAVELLARVAGPGRVEAEPDAAQRLVRLCGYLPLGIRVAAGRLAAKPHWRIRQLADRLADPRHRLDELRLADLQVRARLEPSYRGLVPAAQRAFRLLALLDAPQFGLWTAAVALDLTLGAAHDLIEQLVDARLLAAQPFAAAPGQARYAFHCLVRPLALERAAAEETAVARHAALDRALCRWAGPVAEAC